MRTVKAAVFGVSAIITVAVAEPESASRNTVSSGSCGLYEMSPRDSPVVWGRVAVAIVDEERVVGDAVLRCDGVRGPSG